MARKSAKVIAAIAVLAGLSAGAQPASSAEARRANCFRYVVGDSLCCWVPGVSWSCMSRQERPADDRAVRGTQQMREDGM